MMNFKLFLDTCWFRYRDQISKSELEKLAHNRKERMIHIFFENMKDLAKNKINPKQDDFGYEIECFVSSRKELFDMMNEFSELSKEEQFKILDWLKREIEG